MSANFLKTAPRIIMRIMYRQESQGAVSVPKPQLLIRPQTPDEELGRIRDTLDRMDWFKQHDYSPKLPENPELSKPFSDSERNEKLKLLLAEYKPEVYEVGMRILEANREKIESVFPTFMRLNEAWGFKVFPKYQIAVTRYGMRGSYNSNTGKVLMRVNDEGKFAKGQAVSTPVHEMVHIGVEEPIVKKFKLTQDEKERLVDLTVSTLFSDLLPDYKFQSIGDVRIHSYVTAKTLENLPDAIEQYVQAYPRE